MAQAIGQALPFAVAVAFSPLPVVAVLALLATPGGRRRAVVFVAVAVLCTAALTTAVVLLASTSGPGREGDPATWVSIARLALAALLVRVGVRRWRARPAPGVTPEPPHWMARLDTLTLARTARLGVILTGLNPKNLILIAAGGAVIAQTGAGDAEQAAAVAAFVLVGCAGVALPLVASVLAPQRSAAWLAGLRDWMVRENDTIIAVIAFVIAAKLAGDAISGLAG